MNDVLAKIQECKVSFCEKIKDIIQVPALLDFKSSYIGKDGYVNSLFKSIPSLNNDEKKIFGSRINELKNFIENEISTKLNEIKIHQITNKPKKTQLDITIPSLKNTQGKIHPISQVVDEIVSIFSAFGFDIRFDREVETEFYNFDALNFSDLHPARGMHDTFFVDILSNKKENQDRYILRTHTSSVQIRSMLNQKPPFCFLSPGRTYRVDMDRTHTPMFNQVEGVLVDKNISFANLKWIIEEFLKKFFDGIDITVRFRPSFFPFTEPSAEVDIGIKTSKNEIKYLEVLGCGVIHKNVLTNCNIDSNLWSGFAFGLGVERFAMLKYSIDDLRNFFESKECWINHYGF